MIYLGLLFGVGVMTFAMAYLVALSCAGRPV